MKKYCFFFAAIFFVVPAFGQTSTSLKGGVNVSTLKNGSGFPKNRAGFYGGVCLQIPINKKLSIQPELLYSSKGSMVNQALNSGGYKSNRFNYLNMPVLLNYKFDKKTEFLIGPEFGYLLSVKSILVGGTAIDFTKQYLPKFDFSASIGVQYLITKNITIETRYNYGFKMIYYIDGAGMPHTETKQANRVFQLGIKHSFLKPKK